MQRLSQMAHWIGAQHLGADVEPTGACIDTRQLQPGQLFVALPGSRVDGHDFVAQAAAQGAAAALVSRPVDCDLPQLLVDDVLVGLQRLAGEWRRVWGGHVIGVTGSNGKTSVKTMLASILQRRHAVYATPGNLNNHIGVPLCLLNVTPQHDCAVLEMGANHPGEIAELAAIAAPDVGLVTQAGDAHLEGFGSRDGVARAKGEMFQALGEAHVAVINADDAYADLWRELAGAARIVSFGRQPAAEVAARDERNALLKQEFLLAIGERQAPVSLPLPGRHSVMNALAAAAAAHALGVELTDIVAGLEQMQAVGGRLQVKQTPAGASVIDDSYNANPGSFRAALEVLVDCPGRRHFVLGDMAELGADAEHRHAEAGEAIAAAGIEHLWAVGSLSRAAVQAFGARGRHFEDRAALAEALAAELQAGDFVLVKGSRSAGMDQVVARLMEVRA